MFRNGLAFIIINPVKFKSAGKPKFYCCMDGMDFKRLNGKG